MASLYDRLATQARRAPVLFPPFRSAQAHWLTWPMAITRVASPTQRARASYRMPIHCMAVERGSNQQMSIRHLGQWRRQAGSMQSCATAAVPSHGHAAKVCPDGLTSTFCPLSSRLCRQCSGAPGSSAEESVGRAAHELDFASHRIAPRAAAEREGAPQGWLIALCHAHRGRRARRLAR